MKAVRARDILSSAGEKQSRETSMETGTDVGFSDIQAAIIKMFSKLRKTLETARRWREGLSTCLGYILYIRAQFKTKHRSTRAENLRPPDSGSNGKQQRKMSGEQPNSK